ncbi:hypothetical protein HHI36_013605 [Cryptolaemus montrouzieri]|uniref:Uncharacterized protein n=1 Tax=Cryptolaemus montrouzieri TaxID=559131 RepID=A0ABD2NIQ4_9CUCU
MNKFAIPQWDSNLLGDTICNKLFKNPVKKLGKIKKKGIQKFQDNGKVQKTKNKQKQLKINAKKALKHLKTNAIKSKDLVNIGKNRLLRKQDESDSKKELLDSPNAGISNEKGVHVNQKRNKHFLQSGNNILGNLSEVKKIKNIRFNSKKDQEKVSLLSENIETPIKII